MDLFQGSPGLPADLEAQRIHQALDLLRRTGMFPGIVEDNRQDERTAVILDRHPAVGQEHPVLTFHTDHVMIVVHQLLCLLARTDGNGLAGETLV
jgi:hypothetical protein